MSEWYEDASAIRTPWGELAWPIQEASRVIGSAKEHRKINLGGDILTPDFRHTYDNWYWNPILTISTGENIRLSAEVAEEYIANYIQRHGTNFLVVFVFRQK